MHIVSRKRGGEAQKSVPNGKKVAEKEGSNEIGVITSSGAFKISTSDVRADIDECACSGILL